MRRRNSVGSIEESLKKRDMVVRKEQLACLGEVLGARHATEVWHNETV